MNFLEIDGSYLEGGGQILRTSLALSAISQRPVRLVNIRAKRQEPGLKPQHIAAVQALAQICQAEVSGVVPSSGEVTFIPSAECVRSNLDIDVGTAGGIGLILQPILLVAACKCTKLSLNICGGTTGLGQVPVDYYPSVMFPILQRCGFDAELTTIKRGYYPQGGGEVSVCAASIKHPKPIELVTAGRVVRIGGISLAHKDLLASCVAQRQAQAAQILLSKKLSCPVQIKAEYVDTFSVGTEINLHAYTDSGAILGADERGEKGRRAEAVGQAAAHTLLSEIESGAAADVHLADNLIPWLAFLGGSIRTSRISEHAKTNMWVVEQFFGKMFTVEGNVISVQNRRLA